MNQKTTNDFKHIVLNNTPLIDVRAPIEFKKGAFCHAVNLPILDDDERHAVGKRFVEDGNQGATALGYQIVSGENKARKVDAWLAYLNKYPEALIYCFRGGQRSQIAQEWIQAQTGTMIPRLEGGYKAFRNYLLCELNQDVFPFAALRLGGYTGSGKTALIKKLENAVDLEGLANHRGSTFGSQIAPQPTQINFENNLAYSLIQMTHKGYNALIFEDESRNIGRCCIPKNLFSYLISRDMILLDVPFERRVEITLDEYVVQAQQAYLDFYGSDEGYNLWLAYILNSMYRIKKRLGGTLFNELSGLIHNAAIAQKKGGSIDMQRQWIIKLLRAYYDPMYRYQINENSDKIIFKGNEYAVLQYIRALK